MKMNTKVERKEKMNLTFTLPDDLIVEILSRLPVRSLLRFKCVCKSWLTLISDPQFAKSQFDLAAPTYRFFLDPDVPRLSVSIDIEASLHDDSARVHLTLPHPLSHSLKYDCSEFYGSCRGFILLKYRMDDDLILWNPSTGAQKLIPCPNYIRFLYGFGYDASTDDYLIVFWVWRGTDWEPAWESDIHFFSFQTNLWNKIEGINFPDYDYLIRLRDVFRPGLLFNGALHWLACSNNKVNEIVAFDLTERSLSEIPVPHNLIMAIDKLYNLVVIGGCLSLCKGWRTNTVEIQMLKEYKVQSSWTMIRVQYNCEIMNDFSPAWFTKDGDIVVGSSRRGALMKLNDKGELLEYSTRSPLLVEYMWRPESVMYRESLLSLPDLGKAKDDRQ